MPDRCAPSVLRDEVLRAHLHGGEGACRKYQEQRQDGIMSNPAWSSTRSIRAGLLIIAICLGGFTPLALTTQLHGAVVASGVVEVVSRGQSIQHPDGGNHPDHCGP